MEKKIFTEYSLGIEELALVFSLINRKDLAQQLLASTYDDLTPQQVEERLTAASHSLLARGLTGLSESGTPTLDEDLQKAVFPLAVFDRLFQVSLVIEAGQANMTIHVQKGRHFTAHLVKAGVVHVLTYGPAGALAQYLQGVFEEIGTGETGKPGRVKHAISLATLGEVQGKAGDAAAMAEVLTASGWSGQEAEALSEDLAGQSLRGTLLRINSGHDSGLEAVRAGQNASLLLLKGARHSWLFEFPDTRDASQGSARMVDRPAFEKALAAFIS